MEKIILIDDDQNILTSVSIAFKTEGYHVKSFQDSIEGLTYLKNQHADLAIIDIKMPKMDGLELLNKLREHSSVPVIFLTSRDDEIDQLTGLRMGADDYITKPFSQRLLIERAKAIFRRFTATEENKDKSSHKIVKRGKLFLDPDRHYCSWDEVPVILTVTEFLILQSIATRPGHVKSRDQLMDAAYGENIYVDDRTIDTHIKRMRKKFKSVDNEFSHIETLYGIGYRYRE